MPLGTGRRVSLVIPALNEAESVPSLHAEIHNVLEREGWDAEIVFVDDGSTDGTWEAIERLASADPRVRAIRFRRNFGKAAALSAGFAEATGDYVITLDADLQDDPAEMPAMLAKLDEGLDLVSGWKVLRHDPGHKVAGSRLWNRLVSRLTGVHLHDHNCGFKAYRREVLDEIDLYGEFHRYIPVLAAARGFRVGEVEVEHRARCFGSSKYGSRRILRGIVDLMTVLFLTRCRERPAHALTGTGIVMFLAASAIWWVAGLAISRQGFITSDSAWAWAYTLTRWLGGVLQSLGLTLIPAGLVAQLLVANTTAGKGQYSISERVGGTHDVGAGLAPPALPISERAGGTHDVGAPLAAPALPISERAGGTHDVGARPAPPALPISERAGGAANDD